MLQAAPKGKRRNVEKRREKSRCAARSRREKEAGIFTDLYVTVPIVSESTITHVDRIAVLRLAATLCRVRRVAEKVFPPAEFLIDEPDEVYSETSINESLDGFLMIIDSTGLIIYISPNCSRNLGLTQTDIIGQNLHDYLHNDDSSKLCPTLEDCVTNRAQTLLRMKSVLSPRGRNLTLKSAVYKPVTFTVRKTVVDFPPIQPRLASSRSPPADGSAASYDVDDEDFEVDDDGNTSPDSPVTQLDSTYFVMHGTPLIHCGAGAMGDYHGPGTFMTRHTMDMKFSYCHERLSDFLGYDSKSLMNSSYFSLIHPEDLASFSSSLKELYGKGHIYTGYYRLMVKSGGFIWVATTANTVSHSTRGHGGQYVVCVHQLISHGNNHEICADVQQTSPSLLSKMETERKIKHAKIVGPSTEQLLQRAPIVADYIPLTNPNPMGLNVFGNMIPSSLDASYTPMGGSGGRNRVQQLAPQKQAQTGGECHGDWLFRAVGDTEVREARQQRRSGKRPHIDVAARNSHDGHLAQSADQTTDDVMFVSSVGPFDTITQDDLQRVLFSTMPAASVRPATESTGRGRLTTTTTTTTKQETTQEDFSSLAPFISRSDEILSLDFGQPDMGMEPLSPLLELTLEFDSFNDQDQGALFMLQQDPPLNTGRHEPSLADQAADKDKIESIYRYLRDDEDELQCGVNRTSEPSGLPPLLIVDPSGDQKCPSSLISPWQYQSLGTPPYGLTSAQSCFSSPTQQWSSPSSMSTHSPTYPSPGGTSKTTFGHSPSYPTESKSNYNATSQYDTDPFGTQPLGQQQQHHHQNQYRITGHMGLG